MNKQKNIIRMHVVDKIKNKEYATQISEDELINDEYFQSIKTKYDTLQLFGLSNIELMMILVDNSIKKNIHRIDWCKINPLNIHEDIIKITTPVTSEIELFFELNVLI